MDNIPEKNMNLNDSSLWSYDQNENKVTFALLHICKIGGEDLLKYLTNVLNIKLPQNEIIFETQKKINSSSVADGIISNNFSFKIIIESKIVNFNNTNTNQLDTYLLNLGSSILLYITKDNNEPVNITTKNLNDNNNNLYWTNWEKIIEILNDYLKFDNSINYQILEYLISQFQILLEELKLINNSWNLVNYNVLILAGSWAENVALNYNFYFCQNERTFRSSKFIAFYNNKQISYLFEIVKIPENNIDLSLSENIEHIDYINNKASNYKKGDLGQLFTLNKVKDFKPTILNDKRDKNGNDCPFTYGSPRYTTYDKIMKATYTSQL